METAQYQMKSIIFFVVILSRLCISAENQYITLYATEFLLPETKTKVAQQTIETVSKAIYPKKLKVKVLETIDEIDAAFKAKKPHLAIVGATTYLRHRVDGMRDIATLISDLQPDPDHSVGALLVTRKELPLKSLKDLKGKKLGANHPDGFQGLTVLYKELADQGLDWHNHFSEIKYYGLNPHNRINALKNKEVDVITLNTCFVERMAAKGIDILKDLKPVSVKTSSQAKCKTSTALYPSWSFLILPKIDTKTIVNIAQALHSMPPSQEGEKWTIASDFGAVDDLFKTLKRGPYTYLNNWTVKRVWDEYHSGIVLSVFLIMFFIFHYFRTRYIVALRTSQLQNALKLQKRLLDFNSELTKRYESSNRALTISHLSSLFAHELSQPLSGILLYVRAMNTLLYSEKPAKMQMKEAITQIGERAKKAYEIVQLVRGYAKFDVPTFHEINLEKLIKKVIADHERAGFIDKGEIVFTSHVIHPKIEGEAVELETVLSNLISNSLRALRKIKNPLIEISISEQAENKYRILFTDNGPRIPDTLLDKIQEPFFHLSKEGLGMGLSLVRRIVEKHRGEIFFSRSPLGGLLVEIFLPKAYKESK